MNDTQFYVLITVLGGGLAGIGAAIKFAVSRIVKALDLNSAAMLENTKSNAVLATKVDAMAGYVERRSKIPSDVKDFIREEVSDVHERASLGIGPEDPTPVDQPPHKPRAKSHPLGVPVGSIGGGGYGPGPGKKKDRP